MAYTGLSFGIFFLFYAARYYIATATVLLSAKPLPEIHNHDGVAYPLVSVHLSLYNEKNVVTRLLTSCSSFDYPNYEVIVVDDSNDATTSKLEAWKGNPRFKIIHRAARTGFKGGALREALRQTDPDAKYVVVFDADFVPPPATLKLFISYFENGNGNGSSMAKVAAIQGYQRHVLNRHENWLTRGVSTEFSGSYMIERPFEQMAGLMKMVAGSVFMIRAEVLKKYGWSKSITEDWNLTLRMYVDGYKVFYTPLVEAPGECPSRLPLLIRQRMRWAEGHTFNVKKQFVNVIHSSELTLREKAEFAYFSLYYFQSAFLILGTVCWFVAESLNVRLPFWTAQFGWSLILTNLIAFPFMTAGGLYFEKRVKADMSGILSQILLTYALAPYQAYASLKGLLESEEGSWVRTLKTGKLKGFLPKLEPRKAIPNLLPPVRANRPTGRSNRVWMLAGVCAVLAILLVPLAGYSTSSAQSGMPAYYFYPQSAPLAYQPFGPTGPYLMMHLVPPLLTVTTDSVASTSSGGPMFFSDPASQNTNIPAGSSLGASLWIESPKGGTVNIEVEIYNPASNTVSSISGASNFLAISLAKDVNPRQYNVTWGSVAQNQAINKGETLLFTIWAPGPSPPKILFGSQQYESFVFFPVLVPENAIILAPLAGMAAILASPAVVALPSLRIRSYPGGAQKDFRVVGFLIASAGLLLLTLPLATTINALLTSAAIATHLQVLISVIVPYEGQGAAFLLRTLSLPAGSAGNLLWVSGTSLPVVALIGWNCVGWQSFVLFGVSAVIGLQNVSGRAARVMLLLAGVFSIFLLNILRISLIVLLSYRVGYMQALLFHNYGGTILTLLWLLVFWKLVLSRLGNTVSSLDNEPV